MGTGGGFPIDLILFAMIAVFLVLRLRSILGKRTGFERPPQPYQPPPAPGTTGPNAAPPAGPPPGVGPVIDGAMAPVTAAAAPARRLPDPSSTPGQVLARIRAQDPSFDPGHFLNGAEQAFRMIVDAYAKGDQETLRNLLSPETFASFDAAIKARAVAGESQTTEIRGISDAAIESAALLDSLASITVRFVSDQVSYTLDRDGKFVAGADAVTEITDLWTFERDLKSHGPAWALTAARSA